MTKDGLKKVLDNHLLWICGKGGKRADLSGTNLSSAYLTSAYLTGTNLSSAYLTGTNLSSAYLTGTNLTGADLLDADLSYADLSGADLSGADLSGADLSYADLSGADLSYANLTGANLTGANLTGADLSGAKVKGIKINISPVPDLDLKVYEAISKEGNSLEMSDWHTCKTTHCRAGWAVVVSGEPGKNLEQELGTSTAATLLYAVSRPDKPVPDFYSSNEEAMKSIKEDAGVYQ